MPKVIYANLIWFFIVMVGAVNGSISRHKSEFWQGMPDVSRNYDLLFLGAYGCLFLMSLVGILKRKRWGYECAMGFNYTLSALIVIPFIAIFIFTITNGIPLSFLSQIDLATYLNYIVVSTVSIVFIFFMRRPNIKSLFNKRI